MHSLKSQSLGCGSSWTEKCKAPWTVKKGSGKQSSEQITIKQNKQRNKQTQERKQETEETGQKPAWLNSKATTSFASSSNQLYLIYFFQCSWAVHCTVL